MLAIPGGAGSGLTKRGPLPATASHGIGLHRLMDNGSVRRKPHPEDHR